MNYHPWMDDDDDDSLATTEDRPSEILDKEYLLCEGVMCSQWFPPDLPYKLAPGSGVRLADSIPNIMALLFVSTKLKDILERESWAHFEFLPVRIKDHKGRFIKQRYYIANLLDVVACMDAKRSDFRMGAIIKDQVDRFRRLVIDERKVPKKARAFRLGEKKDLILVREDLAQIIRDAGCTGMVFPDLEDFGAEFRG